tara:strand:+ start:1492 stop:1758 length:267 start_codon:yes stop_codon:yes gene_type:complete
MSLYQLTKEAKEEATLTAITHFVVAYRERSKCDTFDIFEYDIMQEVDEEDPDITIVRRCAPDYKKHQEIHGLNDHLFQKGVRNFVKTR